MGSSDNTYPHGSRNSGEVTEELFLRSENIYNLAEELFEEPETASAEEILEEGRSTWYELNRDRNPVEMEGLPGEDVEVNGTVYHIRGYAHGTPLLNPSSDENIELLNDEVRTFAEEGPVYLEQGFAKHLDEELASQTEVQEMSVTEELAEEYPTRALKGVGRVMADEAVKMPLRQVVGRMDRDFENPVLDKEQAVYQSVRNPESLAEAYNVAASVRMPHHIERSYNRRKDTTALWLRNHRTEAQFNQAYEDTHGFRLFGMDMAQDIHIVTGLAHAPQMSHHAKREFAYDTDYWGEH